MRMLTCEKYGKSRKMKKLLTPTMTTMMMAVMKIIDDKSHSSPVLNRSHQQLQLWVTEMSQANW